MGRRHASVGALGRCEVHRIASGAKLHMGSHGFTWIHMGSGAFFCMKFALFPLFKGIFVARFIKNRNKYAAA